jgi:hypothetical protein
MITQDELECHPANLFDLGIVGDNNHPFRNRCSAGWVQLFLVLDLNQAYATDSLWSQSGTMAQCGYIDPRALGGFQDGSTIAGFHGKPIYC